MLYLLCENSVNKLDNLNNNCLKYRKSTDANNLRPTDRAPDRKISKIRALVQSSHDFSISDRNSRHSRSSLILKVRTIRFILLIFNFQCILQTFTFNCVDLHFWVAVLRDRVSGLYSYHVLIYDYCRIQQGKTLNDLKDVWSQYYLAVACISFVFYLFNAIFCFYPYREFKTIEYSDHPYFSDFAQGSADPLPDSAADIKNPSTNNIKNNPE